MRFETEIDGRGVTLELEQNNGRVDARIGEHSYCGEVLQPEPGVYTILIDNKVYEARVSSGGTSSLQVQIRDRIFSVEIIDRKHRRTSSERGAEGKQNLVAPMPGKVVAVLMKPGDEVLVGQGVVVVEAMKMQNEIKSPKAGKVIEIKVTPGTTVNANQVLAVVE